MTDLPVLPYGSSDDRHSGYAAGAATSEERTRTADADGTTGRRQIVTLTYLGTFLQSNILGHAAGQSLGLTWKELSDLTGWHHGTASGVLSVLHKAGKIARLTNRRDRCFIYVLPEYVNGRDTQPQGRASQPADGLAVALIQAEALLTRAADLIRQGAEGETGADWWGACLEFLDAYDND